MPARLLLPLALVAAAVVAAGCGSEGAGNTPKASVAFCRAASNFDDRLSRGAKLDEQIRLVQRMVDTAPAKIKAEATTFLDALQRVETDSSVKDDPNVKRAVEKVNRYAAQGCGFYESQGGGI